MSIFGSIMSKVFGSSHADATPAAATFPSGDGTPVPDASAPAGTPATGGAPVDIETVMNGMSGSGSLNWRTSIVDLMKLVGLDSSLSARQELADELGYTGDKNDTAPMNIWLHQQVMKKMADNGGKLPDDIKV